MAATIVIPSGIAFAPTIRRHRGVNTRHRPPRYRFWGVRQVLAKVPVVSL